MTALSTFPNFFYVSDDKTLWMYEYIFKVIDWNGVTYPVIGEDGKKFKFIKTIEEFEKDFLTGYRGNALQARKTILKEKSVLHL